MTEFSSPPPDAASLYQAALVYVARYAATRAGLRRVLERRVDRWARVHPESDSAAVSARAAIESVVERLVKAGAVNDESFAETRARALTRSGKSVRAVQAQLVGKGITPGLAQDAAAVDTETELAAALILVRRRRLGPYGAAPAGAAERVKALGVLARAGFPREIAEQALDIPHAEAEARIRELRR